MSTFELDIVQMSLSGNGMHDIAAILGIEVDTVDSVLFAWEDLTDDDKDAYKSNMEF